MSRRSSRAWVLAGLPVAFFGAVAVWAVPFRYAEGKSGRYLLRVLQAADPALFAGDAVVEGLARFQSLFYLAFAEGVRLVGAGPAAVVPALFALHVAAEVVLMLLLLLLARTLEPRHGWALFALLAAWSVFPQQAPVGGEGLFGPALTHAGVATLLGLGAAYMLLRERVVAFWAMLGAALLVHVLMALHLAACLVPAWLLVRRRLGWPDALGAGLFVLCAGLYAFWLMPPPMSGAETQVFLEAKGSMDHVSPWAQPLVGWAEMGLLVGLALLGWQSLAQRGRIETLLAAAILSGGFVAMVLSVGAVSVAWAPLAQLQPMRIFVWVTFLCYVLLGVVAVRAFAARRVLGPLLLGVFIFSIFPTRWELAFLALAVLYVAASRWLPAEAQPRLDRLAKAALVLLVATMVAAWLVPERLPQATFRNPLAVLAGGLLVAVLATYRQRVQVQQIVLGALLFFVLLAGGITTHRYFDSRSYPAWGADLYKARTFPDWEAVLRWCARHTPPQARLIVAGGHDNARIHAWRTTIGEPMSALAWVAPTRYIENLEEVRQVQQARTAAAWNLDDLFVLAQAAQARYVVVEGSYEPSSIAPLVTVGAFRVFEVEP